MNETGNSFITIDLAKIKSNMEKIRNHVGRDVEIMPVLKANACGHGLIRTSDWLWVKECGIKKTGCRPGTRSRTTAQGRQSGGNHGTRGRTGKQPALCGSGEFILPRLPHPGCPLCCPLAQENGRTAPCPYKN